jgi:hypothetical protein
MKLVFGDTGFSAHGSVDVDSKRAAHHERGFELCQFLQMPGDGARRGGVKVQAHGVAEEFRVKGANARTDRHFAETTLHRSPHLRIWMSGREPGYFELQSAATKQAKERCGSQRDSWLLSEGPISDCPRARGPSLHRSLIASGGAKNRIWRRSAWSFYRSGPTPRVAMEG